MKFIEKFRRITSSGEYFAELDGLRFIAIITVVLFHISCSIKVPMVDTLRDNPILGLIYKNGWQGVELFFVISGFIIGLPFAKHYINGEKKVKLKSYFLRRVTRLEPPYIISIFLFFGIQLLAHQNTLSYGLPGVFASMFYLNNIIYNSFSHFVNASLWSLEVEIQFYVFAIFFVQIFRLTKLYRRLILSILILGIPFLHLAYFPETTTVYYFLHFFFLGFLLVDLYLDKKKVNIPKLVSGILGFIALILVLYVNHKSNVLNELIFLIGIFVFYYSVLISGFGKSFFTNRYITVVGGMCYSIYLIHAPIAAAFGNITKYIIISNHIIPNLLLYTVICLPIILIPSAIYFKLIEKPCMDKNWPKKLAGRMKQIFGNKNKYELGEIEEL
jgi:peptidoglycan/LPS O-acetylase OafA/YrhL